MPKRRVSLVEGVADSTLLGMVSVAASAESRGMPSRGEAMLELER